MANKTKGVLISLSDADLKLLDDLVVKENKRRLAVALKEDLEFKPYNRSSFVRFMAIEKYLSFEKTES